MSDTSINQESEEKVNEKDTFSSLTTEQTANMNKFIASPLNCKLFVEKLSPNQPSEWRKAEVLWARESNGKNGPIRYEYYVHYVEFNKRLDEWVPFERLDFSRGVEFPKPEQQKKKKQQNDQSTTPTSGASTPIGSGRATPPVSELLYSKKRDRAGRSTTPTTLRGSASPSSQKRKLEGGESDEGNIMEKEMMMDGQEEQVVLGADDEDGQSAVVAFDEQPQRNGHFSKDQEIEKLRTSGSMTQCVSEIARVKNLDKIQMGQFEVEPWYFAPYPQEYAYCDTLYICEFCLLYWASHRQLERHRRRCQLQHPPGNEIYRHNDISFFEIDGRKQRTWCRNLCLLSKLFLDHKTLYYDVDPFLFYCMTLRDDRGCHLIGYFSKEKESSENYNVACILTLPQYQRHGFGKLLIGFSYLLSKAEGRTGSPEKPLSDLGLLSYRAYWTDTIVDYLISASGDVTIDEIAQHTSITTQDILHTLQNIGALKYYRGQHIICLGDKVIEQWERSKSKRKRVIAPDKLDWKPLHFSVSQLRFM
ncbi:acyl-CoA N-acyltransferase [Halteromyces radiatus]|uniref:acyl-CoA N-acyltransferase n=1 Tax=Halteromyces radiatus TaxID=101107 RepID=UPI00222101CA|nr:acyl-CoA N-acyltransferase [Halteromyces radiatus]KAI8090041.1 acyl-CoA N-acyltransferase [Halteromyces radiatus]